MPGSTQPLLSFEELPEGTVTFLFTDIEGSTQLLSILGERYAVLLADQRHILRETFTKWGGIEVDMQGDAFFVAFPRATQAVGAAVEAQRELAKHKWPEGVNVKVRMGIHTGEPWKAEEGYVGMDVHRAARIAHVGHGGQVLLSETTAALVKSGLPERASLLDLSRHQLKDLPDPEHICQVVIEGLPFEFPPLKSIQVLPSAITLEAEVVDLPDFLTEGAGDSPAPLFVGREREMARLEGCLENARAGKGGVVFIIGGPGEGKTALMEGFVRQSLKVFPDLIVSSGKCNAYTGVGDPYLPFREVLGDLSGDVEAKWSARTISTEIARRLWYLCPLTIQSLTDEGPQLVEVFISGEGLLTRASAAVPKQRILLQKLRTLVESKRTAPSDMEQKALFAQYTQVLCQIAKAHPLLLLLDDLQWADAASVNLLFHLGRCLEGNRILIMGAYRPEEVALGRGEVRHPLESVLNEFKRQYGDVWLDLSRTPKKEGRQFVAAILDSEANRLSESFRTALYAQTEGHPLFTIELLREMQARGDLVEDEEGRWIEGPHLDWGVLPARVEGVIEARIGRLEEELRELLTVASVEGVDFTAQVLARVQEKNDRKLLNQLSAELEKRHRLIYARGEASVGDKILSQYSFTHTLFQQFLYNELSTGEKRLIHKEIAVVLEELYAENMNAISLKLAHHYSLAKDGKKAVPYLLLAGDQTRNIYAHQEAVDYYQRALAFQEALGDFGAAARTQMKMGQTYHSALDYWRANEAYAAGFSLWQRASERQSVTPIALSSETLRFVLRWDPFTLDPGFINDLDSAVVIGQIFSGLLELTPEMDVVPNLALKWEILEGGRRYIFHLRTDALWSDNVPLTAHDFVYAWRRLLNPTNQSYSASLLYDVKGAEAFHRREISEAENLGVRAVDPHTLEVELEAPASYFLQLMTNPAAYPVPRHVIDKVGEAWSELSNLVVNGPFQIENWLSGEALTLTRNPKYHGRFSGNLQRAEIRFIPPSEWSDQVSLYEENKLEVLQISYFASTEITRLRRQFVAEYLSAPLLDMLCLIFNTSREPFNDIRIRRAFMLALDREALGPASGGAIIPALGGLIPPGMPGYSPEIGLMYDPEEAQKLMAQAGYPGGRGFPVVEVLLWPGIEAQIEVSMSHWREVLGVENSWDLVPINDIPERLKVKPPFIVAHGWVADYPDPDSFLRAGFFKDFSGWQGGIYDELVERARRSPDQCERIKLYRQADKMLIDEAIVLPLAYYVGHYLVKPWIRNFPLSPMGYHYLKDVVIEPH